MSFVSSGLSAIGKLLAVALILFAFLAGMAGVVYMSLSGEEITVPEITGKDFRDSEVELASLGLKIKKRADRASTEKMNTVLEQLPKAGETVKTGQLILVVVSKAGIEGDETPKSLIKDIESDDSEKIEEMISDKPKKPKANTNVNANAKKKAETTRDVIGNESDSNSNDNSESKSGDSNKKEPETGTNPTDKNNKNTFTRPTVKPQNTPLKPAAVDKRPVLRNRPE